MRSIFVILAIFFISCQQQKDVNDVVVQPADSLPAIDKTDVVPKPVDTIQYSLEAVSNDRFKDVILRRISKDSARLTGKARIFEATLSYAVYDKGKQVYEGFKTTTAGAPEWGQFDFNIGIPVSSGHQETYLLLYESSAKDGSRVGILKISL